MRARTKVAFGTAAAAFALALSFVLTPAFSGFTASVRNTNSGLGSGTSFITASANGSKLCSSVPSGNTVPATDSFACAGSQLPSRLSTSGVSNSTISLAPSGTVASTLGALTFNSCGVMEARNRVDSSNSMLLRYGVSLEQDGPLPASKAMAFNGADSMLTDTVKGNSLSNFTLGVWFKTSSPQGAMFGFTNSSSAVAPTSVGNQLYMSSNGRVNFSSYNGSIRTVTSSNSYADNRWHYAVVVGTSNLLFGLQSNLTLYIDNQRVATNTFTLSGQLSENRQGFWRAGHSQSNGSYPGNGQYFNGSLSSFTVFDKSLSAAQVSRLYSADSQAQIDQRVAELGATDHWAMDDSGDSLYQGALPDGETGPCAQTQATIASNSACVAPVSNVTCGAPGSVLTLASLSGKVFPNVSLGTPQTPDRISMTLNRSSNFSQWNNGLHVKMPSSLSLSGFPQTFSWSDNEMVIQ